MAPQPIVLSIAGTDPSGGAGIQADLKTFTVHGCYGTSVVTALVAQNTTGVQEVYPIAPAFVEKQISSVLDDMTPATIKTGMLFDEATIRAVVGSLRLRYTDDSKLPPIVCDPVSVSTSGHTLLQPDAVDVLIKELFPMTALITPNKAEAELLLSKNGLAHSSEEINSLKDMLHGAQSLLNLGPKGVLLKGGHILVYPEDVDEFSRVHGDVKVVRDGVFDSVENVEILVEHSGKRGAPEPKLRLVADMLTLYSGATTLFVRPHIESTSTHGTGCTLSAAIACRLACGDDLVKATRDATVFTHQAIVTAPGIGRGNGPLNHTHALSTAIIPQSSPNDPYPFTRLLIQNSAEIWKQYVEHDFVKLLGSGELRKECFVHFLKQDYQYLKYYARAYALLAAKSTTFPSIGSATQTIVNVLNEINTHKALCSRFGVSLEELERTPESPATTAYGAYIIDTGLRGDEAMLLMALLACLLGYGEVGLWLKRQAWVKLEGNPYVEWIEDYSGEWYQGAVKLGLGTIEKRAKLDPPSEARFAQWCEVWERCTRFEKGFWDMALQLS